MKLIFFPVTAERQNARKKLSYKYCVKAQWFSMASSRASRASSGYSSRQNTPVKPRLACYWLESCDGSHALDQCSHWKNELAAQVDTYYSPLGIPRHYDKSEVKFKYNPTGCRTVHILIYTIRSQGEKEILFGLNGGYNELVLPSSKPHRRGESSMEVARRTLKWITENTVTVEQGLKARFLFDDANIIHPVYLTNDQADLLTQKFVPNETIQSLHWFLLETVFQKLPERKSHRTRQVTKNEPGAIQLGKHHLWSLIAQFFIGIRENVLDGYETFFEQ